MACRVYRNTRFGLFREDEISTTNMSRDIPVFNAQTQQTSGGIMSGGGHNIRRLNIMSVKGQKPLTYKEAQNVLKIKPQKEIEGGEITVGMIVGEQLRR
ncbi:hypothetical protein JR316_0011622 [Psilocybe cubensis]|uniref:Uncharacterized protein n=1 Tax=Psilocybe cubensis TaxID=181762 RepID=A0ACB8GKY6_PSICU|nr:hypothetical protein JR316_0011622 [Psilocybe cubensis]KAH9476052.1 hypothetical protein JR316_0011622 [Psilocybe cubensis]